MDDERYLVLSTSSNHTMDLHIDIEDESDEEDDDLKTDYVCPFCLDDFDLVGFCCHIDDGHPIEAKSGICPICAKKVGINMAVHIITQHGSILKISFIFFSQISYSFICVIQIFWLTDYAHSHAACSQKMICLRNSLSILKSELLRWL
ncbi:hypothetical protein CsSME_00047418 [Camellia sinensis var. sinensis]